MTAQKENAAHGKFFLPALGLAVFASWLVTVTFELNLTEIAHSFHVGVGMAGLTAAVGSTSGIVAGLLLAFISLRFNHKLLLSIGLVCTSLAAIGFFVAPTYGLLLVPNIGVGFGIAFTTAMSYSLIGDFYSIQKRGWAIGWIVAATALTNIIGLPIISFISTATSWRGVLIWFSLPVTLASLFMVTLAVPKKKNLRTLDPAFVKEPFFEGCKQAARNRSAVAALFVTLFSMAEGSIVFYAVSLFQFQYGISLALGSLVLLVGNVLSAAGGVVAGSFVNRVGRKNLGSVACLLAASLTLTFSFMPTFELSWVLNAVRFWFAGMSFAAGGSLVIEQLPKFRSTMMSLNTAFMNGGMLLASLAGGVVLDHYSYQTFALFLGGLGVAGTVIWITLVKEPCKQQKQDLDIIPKT